MAQQPLRAALNSAIVKFLPLEETHYMNRRKILISIQLGIVFLVGWLSISVGSQINAGEKAANSKIVGIGVIDTFYRDLPRAIIPIANEPLLRIFKEKTGMTAETLTLS